MEETQADRKSRLAELAKAIKAKKTDISKSLEKVNSEVKRSLSAPAATLRRRAPTVLEEAQRLEHEEITASREVEEVRSKSGVIRRRMKNPPPTPAPVAPVKRAEPASAPPIRAYVEPEPEPEPEMEAEPAAEPVEPPPRPVAAPPREPSQPEIRRPAAVTPAPQPQPAPPVVAARAPEPPPAPAKPSEPAVPLIKRAGRDVTPQGLTFTPHQPKPVAPARAGVVLETDKVERGVAIPGTERKAPGGKREIFELKELTFGPGQLHGGRRKRVIPKKQQQKTQITTPKAIKRKIAIEGAITVSTLAARMSVKANEVIKKLMGMGMMVTMNQSIDADTATLVASEFGYEVSNVAFDEAEVLGQSAEEAETSAGILEPRPPVVTVMGHVDHGKTSLLDAIRKTNVAAGEAGGITQHIGAYQIAFGERKITFLDTPGHEAFTAMRARGAKVTDIVVLVCAVDDGPQPQTIEAINHAKAASVPIIVALNKVDKPGTNPEDIMRKLGTEHGLTPEEWGGETMYVKTSAKTGAGVKDLLESIVVRADVMELKANPVKPAVGTIVEAKIDKGRGPVVTVLVQEGTLRVGDAIVSGAEFGKVRALMDERGKQIKEAGPATPVEVLGLSGVPEAGDQLHVAADLEAAKAVSAHRTAKARESTLGTAPRKPTSADNLFAGAAGGAKELNIVVKADVQGSVEALKTALEKLSTEKVKVNVVAGFVGAITESDVQLAAASKAIIVGFNVKPDNRGREMSEQEHIDVRTYSIIYEALDDVRGAMVGLLEPIYKETPLGKAEVRALFGSSKVGTVAGCMVVEGKIKRNAKARLLREGKVLFDGKMGSLKRFKDDAGEVAEGFECGMSLEGWSDIQVGDTIACYTVEQVQPTL